MIIMVYAGVFLLVYGVYHLIAYWAYLPSAKSGRSISGFWKAVCLELALYTRQRFSLAGVSSGRLQGLLQLNQEKKGETVWLLEKCIGSIGVFCLCIPLLLVQLKVFLLCLGVGMFAVWNKLFLYCAKSIHDKGILQRELPFFLLLRWRCSAEGRNQAEYLKACQMAVAEEIPKEEWELLAKEYAAGKSKELTLLFNHMTVDDSKANWEYFRKKRIGQMRRNFRKNIVKIKLIGFFLVFLIPCGVLLLKPLC